MRRLTAAVRRLPMAAPAFLARRRATLGLGLLVAFAAALVAGQLLSRPPAPTALTDISPLPLVVAVVRRETPAVPTALAHPARPPVFPSPNLLAAASPEPRPLARPAGLARPTAVARATRRQAPPAATAADRLVRGLLGPPARAIPQAAREFKRLTGTDRRRN
jgi:hypothetical protein